MASGNPEEKIMKKATLDATTGKVGRDIGAAKMKAKIAQVATEALWEHTNADNPVPADAAIQDLIARIESLPTVETEGE